MAKKDINFRTGKIYLSRKDYANRNSDYADAKYYNEHKNRMKSADTIKRQNIHKDITNMISEGKGKIEILVFLNNKYPDTYLSKFFFFFIDHYMIKEKTSIETEEEVR